MNSPNYICVWDTETNSTDTANGEVVQIAALMIDPHTLEIVPDSEFNSFVKPVNILSGTEAEKQEKWNKCSGAWNVNKITREQLEKAPLPEHVWKAFAKYVKGYNKAGWNGKPIASGHNIQGFDMIFLQRACQEYGLADKQGKQQVFNNRVILDTLNICFLWFDHNPNYSSDSLSMDNLRQYFGINEEGSHDALVDTKTSADILIRFLKLHRHYGPRVKFKGSFAKNA